LPKDLFLEAVEHLVRIDREWIPPGEGSLYLYVFMFADEVALGARPASEYVFCALACPSGAYFGRVNRSLKVWVSEKYSRAAPGGTGAAKCAGNYAGSFAAGAEANAHGCDQAVFLDATERRWVEESGAMNIFFAMSDGSLLTPPTNGNILPGITRATIITLARDRGIRVDESNYSFESWKTDASSGRLREVFGCGTAVVVTGISEVHYPGGSFCIGGGVTGEISGKFREQLTNIHHGRDNRSREWLRIVA
jgi:branched-chain amino acid aminotransferase